MKQHVKGGCTQGCTALLASPVLGLEGFLTAGADGEAQGAPCTQRLWGENTRLLTSGLNDRSDFLPMFVLLFDKCFSHRSLQYYSCTFTLLFILDGPG